jgi:hypothetical protein
MVVALIAKLARCVNGPIDRDPVRLDHVAGDPVNKRQPRPFR